MEIRVLPPPIILSLFLFQHFKAQSDYLRVTQDTLASPTKFKAQQLVVPISLITLGAIGKKVQVAKDLDKHTHQQVINNFQKKYHFDDYLQYAPAIGVFALSNFGVKPKHSLKERLIVTATAYAIMGVTVNTVKYTSNVVRPDQSQANSFPSGHTANAFLGAELLWQEYKDESIWIGLGGYTVATATGVMRVINKKHWITDVLAGAGFGILSVKLAYCLLPTTSKWFTKKSKNPNIVFVAYPTYLPEGNAKGLGVMMRF